MTQAKLGDTVKIHFVGWLDDGSEIESSADRGPVTVVLGEQKVPAGIEEGIVGMATGEKRRLNLAPDQAFGPHRPELVHSIERAEVPDHIDLEIGMRLEASGPDGEPIPVTVIDLDDGSVTLDANHPFAGRGLIFEIELVEVV